MKIKKFLLLFFMLIIIIPNVVKASCDSGWLSEPEPNDPLNSTYRIEEKKTQYLCLYPNAVGSCKNDDGYEVWDDCGNKKTINVTDYLEKDFRIYVIYYNVFESDTHTHTNTETYNVCIKVKAGGGSCMRFSTIKERSARAAREWADYIERAGVPSNYMPLQFTDEEFEAKLSESGACPDMWKKCKDGWSYFYLSDPGSGSTLLAKQTKVKHFQLSGELNASTCNSLLGNPANNNTPAYFLSFAFKVVRFVAIVLLIVLSGLDFLSSTASNDSDAAKKSFTKAGKRLVIAILIFVLPILLEFILSIINEKEVNLCISTSNETGYTEVVEDTTE